MNKSPETHIKLCRIENGVVSPWKGLQFTKYQIKESDMRIKTFTFTSPEYLDLTRGRLFVEIICEGHENVVGIALSVEEDPDTGLYNYQCQDLNRMLTQKKFSRFVNKSVYDTLKAILKNYSSYIGTENRLWSDLSLKPKKEYLQKEYEGIQSFNPMDKTIDVIYDKVTYGDQIRSLLFDNNVFVDFYFPGASTYPVIEPYSPDEWLGKGLYFTTPELASYNMKFDITNIITGVAVKPTDTKTGNTTLYQSKDLLGVNLSVFYGTMQTTIDNPTQNNSTSSNSAGGPFNKCGVSTDRSKIMAIGRPSASGELSKYGYKFYKSTFERKCAFCGSNELYWGIFWAGNETSNWGRFECTGNNEGGSAEGHIFCKSCDADFSCIDGKDHISPPRAQLTRIGEPVESSKEEAYKLKNGEYGSDLTNSSTNTNVMTNSGNATTNEGSVTVDSTSASNVELEKQKAIETMTESVRDLLTFKMKIPGGNPQLKKLHTNSFIWTELPERFVLKNFKSTVDAMKGAYTRYTGYVLNRWYVEGVTITHDDSGLWFELELNPFASSYSSYMNILSSAQDAYANANQQQNNTGSTSSISQRTDGKTDCSSTYDLCCNKGSASISSLQNKKESALAQGAIGKTGTNYANAVQGMTGKEAYKYLQKRVVYGSYSDNKYNCASDAFNHLNYLNCAESARLLKACMDVVGQPCVIYHVPNHYMNGVLINGRWETVDLCYQAGTRPEYQTAGWNR